MLKINNIDMSAYGIELLKGSQESYVQLAALKSPDTVQWYEGGFSADLSDPVLNIKSVKIKVLLGSSASYSKLKEIVLSQHYNTWDIGVGRVFTLRTTKLSSYSEYGDKFQTITIELSHDTPNECIDEEAEAVGGVPADDTITIDGVSLSDYGIGLLKGWREAINAPSPLATPLTTKSTYTAGATNHALSVRTTARDITIPLYLKSSNITNLWANYDAFATALLQPDFKEMVVKDIAELECYYQSITVSDFHIGGSQILMAFKLKITAK